MLHRLGHTICGFVGTTTASNSSTQSELKGHYGIECAGYLSLAELFSENRIDIVVICSPADTHHEYIEQALLNNCDVIVEKPMLWMNETRRYQDTLQHLLKLATQQNRLLYMIAQWPFTLPYFRQLYPDLHLGPGNIHRFSMQLSPMSSGTTMIVDSSSHLLSMLYSLLGTGNINDLTITPSPKLKTLLTTLKFRYQHACGQTDICFELCASEATIKPAGYAINERSVQREVILPEYSIHLRAENRQCAIIDPMLLCLKDFLSAVTARISTDTEVLLNHGRHLRFLAEQLELQLH